MLRRNEQSVFKQFARAAHRLGIGDVVYTMPYQGVVAMMRKLSSKEYQAMPRKTALIYRGADTTDSDWMQVQEMYGHYPILQSISWFAVFYQETEEQRITDTLAEVSCRLEEVKSYGPGAVADYRPMRPAVMPYNPVDRQQKEMPGQ